MKRTGSETMSKGNRKGTAPHPSGSRRKERFTRLVEEHKFRAYRIALALVKNHEDAMDLCQEAFLKSFRAWNRYDPGRPFFPWFYRILRNACLSFLERRKKRSARSLSPGKEDQGDLDIPDRDTDPGVLVERDETKRKVWEAFNRLGFNDREIIMLRHFQGLSYEEMAELLDIPMGTVMSRLYHARQRMKGMLEAYIQ